MSAGTTLIRVLLSVAAIAVLVLPPAAADPVPAYVTERAGIDTLERFLVVRDYEQETWFGEQIVPLGDITGDGAADVLICRRNHNQSPPYPGFLVYGGPQADSLWEAEFPGLSVNIAAIGDVDGDGHTDLGSIVYPQLDFGIYFGGPGFDDTADFLFPQIWSVSVPIAADIDGDGALDLPLARDVNGGYVNIYRVDDQRDTIPECVIPDTATGFGNNLTTGEFNGDGWADLAVAAYWNRDTSVVKFYWGGPSFDTIPDLTIRRDVPRFGRFLVPLGDFNADGYGDIYIGGDGTDYNYGVYFGGPDIDDQMDVIIDLRHGGSGWQHSPRSADCAGDVNNDGYPDLIIGLFFQCTDINQVHIFLGGPIADTIRIADVMIDMYGVPGPQAFFGQKVAGVGDFNGDGIDDFAVRSNTACGGINWWGEVNFFLGWDGHGTDVPIRHDPTLPDGFNLRHNYPNPFNPGTTIEFDLPVRTHARLTIYNILGEEISTLVDRDLTTGTYSVEWDGRSRSGESVASGVYFYRLEAGGAVASHKMLLLR